MMRVATLAMMLVAGCAMASGGLVNYQGRLTDPGGAPITEPVTVSFAFFDAAVDGSKVSGFIDADTVTPDAQGLYSTMIGDDPDLLIPPEVFASGPVWLEVAVNDAVLSPRKQIASVPAALGAQWSGALVNEFEVAAGVPPITKHQVVSILTTGRVRGSTIPDAPAPGTTFGSGTVSGIRALRLDENRALVVWYESELNVAVADFSGGAATFGPSATAAGYATGVEVALLDTSRAVLHSSNESSPFRIAEISGNTVTLSEPVFQPGDMTGTYFGFAMEGLSETDFALCYVNQFIGQAFVRICRVAGAGITFGDAASNAALERDINRIVPRRIPDGRLAFAFTRGVIASGGVLPAPRLRLMTGSRSGTTVDITTSLASELTSADVTALTDFQMISASRGAILYEGASRQPRLMGVQFSPFFQNSNGVALERSGRATSGARIAPIQGEFFDSLLVTEAGPDGRRYARIASFPFLEPQFEDPYGFNLTGGLPSSAAVVPLSAARIAVFSYASGVGGTSSVATLPPAESLRVPIGLIGVAAADSDGATALVATHGVAQDYTPGALFTGPAYDNGNGGIMRSGVLGFGRLGIMTPGGDLLIDADTPE